VLLAPSIAQNRKFPKMTMTNVRPALERDLPALKAIVESNDLFPADLLTDMTTAYFAKNPDNEIWLTTDTKKPAGLLYCKPETFTSGTANMLLLAVSPDFHRQGIGGILVEALESQLRTKDFHLLIVETSSLPKFAPARSFYLGNGFKPVGEINDFYAIGEGKIIYAKRLT
jgi:ribosomal protein S18 acetylase RimI-like enzyme